MGLNLSVFRWRKGSKYGGHAFFITCNTYIRKKNILELMFTSPAWIFTQNRPNTCTYFLWMGTHVERSNYSSNVNTNISRKMMLVNIKFKTIFSSFLWWNPPPISHALELCIYMTVKLMYFTYVQNVLPLASCQAWTSEWHFLFYNFELTENFGLILFMYISATAALYFIL